MTLVAEAWPKDTAPENSQKVGAPGQPTKWPCGAYRLLVDTHVPDWDPHLLANFDTAEYVQTIAQTGFQSVMQWVPFANLKGCFGSIINPQWARRERMQARW